MLLSMLKLKNPGIWILLSVSLSVISCKKKVDIRYYKEGDLVEMDKDCYCVDADSFDKHILEEIQREAQK